jgi:hypothetical protein
MNISRTLLLRRESEDFSKIAEEEMHSAYSPNTLDSLTSANFGERINLTIIFHPI